MLKKLLTILLSVFLLLGLVGCGSSKKDNTANNEEQQTEEVQEELPAVEEEEKEPLTTPAEVKITYDLSTLPSADVVGKRIGSSYFGDRLLGSEIEIYNKIVTAVADWQEEISLSNCDEKTLARIMNIILLDCTSAYNLNYEYSYEMQEESQKMVSKVYPSYSISKEEYNAVLDEINTRVRTYEEYIMSNKDKITALTDAAKDVISYIPDKSVNTRNAEIREYSVFTALSSKTQEEHAKETGIYYSTMNDLETAKLFNLLLHHAGVNSLVALADYKGSRNSDLVSVTTDENGRKHALINHEDFIWFNEVEVNNEWYIVNLHEEYTRYAQAASSKSYNDIITSPHSFYSMVTDRIYANSHIFWITDENLGILPPCNSLDFVYSYRENQLIPMPNIENPTDEQLKKYVSLFVERLVDEVSPKSMAQSPTIFIRFETPELYNIYNEFFSENVKNFSSISGRRIEDYSVEYHPEALVIILHNFYSY